MLTIAIQNRHFKLELKIDFAISNVFVFPPSRQVFSQNKMPIGYFKTRILPLCSLNLIYTVCNRYSKCIDPCAIFHLFPFPNKPRFLSICKNSLLKTLEKGETANNKQFLLFPQCFLPVWQTFCHSHQIKNCCMQGLRVWKNLQIVIWEWVNLLSFIDICKTPCVGQVIKSP